MSEVVAESAAASTPAVRDRAPVDTDSGEREDDAPNQPWASPSTSTGNEGQEAAKIPKMDAAGPCRTAAAHTVAPTRRARCRRSARAAAPRRRDRRT